MTSPLISRSRLPNSQTASPLQPLQIGKLCWHLRDASTYDLCARVLQDPEAHLANPALYLKNSRVVTIARVPAAAPPQPDLILRRLNYGKFQHRLRDIFRPTRAHRALVHGLMLEEAGVATARSLAAGERRLLRWPRSAYLITEEIRGATTLAKLIDKKRWPSRIVVHRLAGLIARLHNQGFSHRDLKSTNILFDSALEPFLIDLDGIRSVEAIGEERAAADLAVLARGTLLVHHVSPISGWRFLKRYCELRRMDASIRQLATEITRAMKKQ